MELVYDVLLVQHVYSSEARVSISITWNPSSTGKSFHNPTILSLSCITISLQNVVPTHFSRRCLLQLAWAR